MADRKAKYILDVEDRTKLALRKAEANFSRFGKSVNRTVRALGGFGALAGGASVAGLVAFGKEAFETADRIAKMADATGLGVEEFQRLSQAANLAGIETSQFESNMTAFVKRVGEAKNGLGPLVSGLKGWNDELLDSIKNSKNQGEALDLIADAMESADTATERAAIANAAFSRAGIQMVNMLGDGSRAVKELTSDMTVLSEENARVAEEINDQWNVFFTNFTNGLKNMAINFVHFLNTIGKANAEFTGGQLSKEIASAQEKVNTLTTQIQTGGDRQFIETKLVPRLIEANKGLAELNDQLATNNAFEFQADGIWEVAEAAKVATENTEKLRESVAGEIKKPSGGGSGRKSGGSASKSLASDVEDATEAIKENEESLTEWEDTANSAISSFSSGFADTLVDGIMDGKVAFEDFAKSFLANIAKMIIEQTLLNAVTGGAEGTNIIGSIAKALISHDGGVVGSGGPTRAVSPLVFAGAPRYHSGTIPGLAYDERAAILQTGETVLSRKQSKNIGGVSINQSFDFRGSSDVGQLRAESERIKQETLAAVEISIRRGGSLARAVGRKS